MKNPILKILIGLFLLYIILNIFDNQSQNGPSENKRNHVEDFCGKGFFTDLFSENDAIINQYGFLDNSAHPNTFIIKVEFRNSKDFNQIKKMISEFARKNHFNWSIGHDWTRMDDNDDYAISYYETSLNILVFYYYNQKHPNNLIIAVNTYSEVLNSKNN